MEAAGSSKPQVAIFQIILDITQKTAIYIFTGEHPYVTCNDLGETAPSKSRNEDTGFVLRQGRIYSVPGWIKTGS
jgi:hypothetical protein